jgi:hypothetical protein
MRCSLARKTHGEPGESQAGGAAGVILDFLIGMLPWRAQWIITGLMVLVVLAMIAGYLIWFA